jgi:hypothetical protein
MMPIRPDLDLNLDLDPDPQHCFLLLAYALLEERDSDGLFFRSDMAEKSGKFTFRNFQIFPDVRSARTKKACLYSLYYLLAALSQYVQCCK